MVLPWGAGRSASPEVPAHMTILLETSGRKTCRIRVDEGKQEVVKEKEGQSGRNESVPGTGRFSALWLLGCGSDPGVSSKKSLWRKQK